MRERTIKVSDGSEGRGYMADVRFDLSGDAARDIARAVEIEHTCDESYCDISAALGAGYPFSAAHLLVGATETPVLDRVLAHYGLSQIEWPADWQEWVAWHTDNGRECPSCESFIYSADAETCSNCGHSF